MTGTEPLVPLNFSRPEQVGTRYLHSKRQVSVSGIHSGFLAVIEARPYNNNNAFSNIFI